MWARVSGTFTQFTHFYSNTYILIYSIIYNIYIFTILIEILSKVSKPALVLVLIC